ncbi:acetyl-CoA acetyltransferase [Mycobacterium sp. C31M]
MSRTAVIVGVADHELDRGRLTPATSVLSAQARVARAALAEAGLGFGDVDGLLTSGMWGIPGPGQLPTLTLAEFFGIQPRFSNSSNIGGSVFESFVPAAARAIEKGDCEVALIVFGSTQRSDRGRVLGRREPILTTQYETPWGLPLPVGAYALCAMRHMHEYGTRREDLAQIAVETRRWAQLNPAATSRDPLTIDDVLTSTELCDPLRVLDCCLVTDGAGAIVMTTEEHARAAGVTPIYLRGHGEYQSHWTVGAMPDLTVAPAKHSAAAALQMASVGVDQVDVIELYDSFTITVLMTLEALGLFEPGEGGAWLAAGNMGPGGAHPVNTAGGGLSHAHPGMYGIFLLIEAVRQLRGEAGDRQVPAARTALVNGTGGAMSSAATCILATS